MIGVAVIGCGQWGMNHVRNFSSLPDAQVLWCCDSRAERLADVQHRYPGIRVAPDFHAALADAAVQAVVIATPSSTHYAVAQAALERGKDVLCEKPLTTSSAHCDDLVRLAHSRHCILMVGHVFVFNPAVQKLREYIATGALGRLYYLSARRTNLGPIRSDVDAVWDLASHDASIFDYLLDGALPSRISAYGGAFLDVQRADAAFVTLEYPQQIVANIQVSWLDPQKRREITIVGSEKMAIFNDVALDAPLWIYDKGAKLQAPYESFEQFRVLSWERDAMVPMIPRVEPLLNETQHFLRCVAQRQLPQTDGVNGSRIVRVLEAIARSMEQHGAPMTVEWNQP